MQQGFGRKGIPEGGAVAQPRPMARPLPAPAPVQRTVDDPYASMRAEFLAQERANDAGANTLAWSTPTTGRSWHKSKVIAYLLWLFVGAVAGHRIYCGRYISAGLQSVLGLIAVSAIMMSPTHMVERGTRMVETPTNIGVWGPLLMIYGMWRLLDLFLIPGMCKNPPASY